MSNTPTHAWKVYTKKAANGDTVEWWYNRQFSCWTIRAVDAQGNQCGSADYAGTKGDRDSYIRTYINERAKRSGAHV